MSIIQTTQPAPDQRMRLYTHIQAYLGLAHSIGDDPSTFAAMGLILYELVNGQAAPDPIKFLKDLNLFILHEVTKNIIIEGEVTDAPPAASN